MPESAPAVAPLSDIPRGSADTDLCGGALTTAGCVRSPAESGRRCRGHSRSAPNSRRHRPARCVQLHRVQCADVDHDAPVVDQRTVFAAVPTAACPQRQTVRAGAADGVFHFVYHRAEHHLLREALQTAVEIHPRRLVTGIVAVQRVPCQCLHLLQNTSLPAGRDQGRGPHSPTPVGAAVVGRDFARRPHGTRAPP